MSWSIAGFPKSVGGADLPFNLDFYTEVQDLDHLLPVLSREQAASVGGASGKWDALNEALIGLIEDHGLIGFETLAVEDRQSMTELLRAIDRANPSLSPALVPYQIILFCQTPGFVFAKAANSLVQMPVVGFTSVLEYCSVAGKLNMRSA